MSDLRGEYPELIEAYEKYSTQSDLQTKFEAQWRTVFSMVEAAKEKASAVDATAPVKETETLIRSLTEPFSKVYEAQRGAAPAFPNIPAALARSTGGFCLSCGSKLSHDAVFCRNCGTKVR